MNAAPSSRLAWPTGQDWVGVCLGDLTVWTGRNGARRLVAHLDAATHGQAPEEPAEEVMVHLRHGQGELTHPCLEPVGVLSYSVECWQRSGNWAAPERARITPEACAPLATALRQACAQEEELGLLIEQTIATARLLTRLIWRAGMGQPLFKTPDLLAQAWARDNAAPGPGPARLHYGWLAQARTLRCGALEVMTWPGPPKQITEAPGGGLSTIPFFWVRLQGGPWWNDRGQDGLSRMHRGAKQVGPACLAELERALAATGGAELSAAHLTALRLEGVFSGPQQFERLQACWRDFAPGPGPEDQR